MYVCLIVDSWHLSKAHVPHFCKSMSLLASAATLAERICFFSASVNGLSLSFVERGFQGDPNSTGCSDSIKSYNVDLESSRPRLT